MVIAYHLEGSVDWFNIPVYLKFMINGHIGVNIFFVISGFLITTLLMNEMHEQGRIDVGAFYRRRALRILPAYYFLLFVYFLLQLAGTIKLTNSDWFYSITLLKQFNNPGGLTGHLWSISAEEFFYLFYPPLFIWLYPLKKKILNYSMLMVACAIVPVAWIILTHHFHTYGFNIFMRGDAIAIGCLLALNYPGIRAWAARTSPLIWAAIPALFLLDTVLFSSLAIQEYPLMTFWGEAGWSLPDNIAIALLLTLSIEKKSSFVFSLLNSAPLVFLGRISYSIYLWQQLFTSNLQLGYFNLFPVNILVILIVSLLSYKLIEKPFLRMKNKRAYSPATH